VADLVEAALDVAFQNPLRAAGSQCQEALLDGIGAGPLLPKPVRVSVRFGLHDGVDSQQVERLHGSVLHRGDAERAHFAIRLQDVDARKGLRSITAPLQLLYCLSFLLRGVPDRSVHPRRLLACISRHSANGQYFAAGVGEQPLQGLHLAPPACLRRLHDTHLEPAHVPLRGRPVPWPSMAASRAKLHQQLWLSSSALPGKPGCASKIRNIAGTAKAGRLPSRLSHEKT
jgi:hypothetical protein